MADLEALDGEAHRRLELWARTLDQADEMYDRLPRSMRTWVDVNGGDLTALIPMLAMLRPDERELAHLVVGGALGCSDRLSHPVSTFDGAAGAPAARAKSGGEKMGGVEDRVSLLEDRITEIEEWNSQLADVLRRRTEELREAGGRLESAERRLSKLLDRHEELERYAAQQLGRDVDDLRKAVRGIGIVASALEPRPVQVDQ